MFLDGGQKIIFIAFCVPLEKKITVENIGAAQTDNKLIPSDKRGKKRR
jgi:hypothetical protein